jgi:sorting nexin-1/2
VTEAEERLRASKIAYEELVATMTEELNRWQKERAADMAALLRDFALAQVGKQTKDRSQTSPQGRWLRK